MGVKALTVHPFKPPHVTDFSLTPRQRRVLDEVHAAIERAGRPPSGPELAARLGVSAQSAYRHLQALEEKGYIALEQTGVRKPLAVRLLEPARLVLQTGWARLGSIPAGPLDYLVGEDVEQVERLEDILPSLQPGDVFLEVDGDSMVGAGLVHGMTVVVRPGRTPRPGDICAVWVDGEGGTLKRIYREGASVRLVPENAAHAERTLPAEQVLVQGVLVMALDIRQF
jgi:repressor LexA